jgi:DNA polymerase-4
MAQPRAILHVDMDAFFAAIAELDDPTLKGKAVLIGGTGPRAVVTTASYEARRFGCRSAMPMSQARRLCPHALVVGVPGSRIREMSARVFEVLEGFSPLVEPVSVDEAFLDVTGSQRLLGPPEAIARQLKDKVYAETGLIASVGVAPNKFLAKLASDMDKPDGLTIITPENLDKVLLPLPVEKLWGVGPKLREKLERHAIHYVHDLRRLSEERLTRLFGDHGARLYRLCRGLDDRPVVPDHEAKSIGQEQTFPQDIEDPDHVRAVMLDQAQQVGRRLRAKSLTAKTVTVKIRFGDFQTITRAHTLDHPTDLTDDLFHAARVLFDRWAQAAFSPVRLIGVTASGLARSTQGELFADDAHERRRRVDALTDHITQRFGKGAIRRAGPNA